MLRLTLLAPDIVQGILDGRPQGSVMLPRLLAPFPADWAQQLHSLADPCASAGSA
ncbi:hypothetical protein [Falsiroseomonas sp.]|uniref:hypothetical protein n=1 Tax=Falsiroseomonas sp. TaxID=2870721 RepID=UPI003562A014